MKDKFIDQIATCATVMTVNDEADDSRGFVKVSTPDGSVITRHDCVCVSIYPGTNLVKLKFINREVLLTDLSHVLISFKSSL